MKLSVIVPVYNEEATVGEVIEAVRNCGISELQIIVVDDCSTDGTDKRLEACREAPDMVIERHPVNRGKGAAIRTAQHLVEGDAVVVQDADLEYKPTDLPALLALLERGEADAVYGTRYADRSASTDAYWHYFGNRCLTAASNLFSRLKLTDMETCYKMIRADVFKQMRLQSDRFGIEPEITAKLARQKCRIREVPVSYTARDFDEGKKIGWKDGVSALWSIFKYNVLR